MKIMCALMCRSAEPDGSTGLTLIREAALDTIEAPELPYTLVFGVFCYFRLEPDENPGMRPVILSVMGPDAVIWQKMAHVTIPEGKRAYSLRLSINDLRVTSAGPYRLDVVVVGQADVSSWPFEVASKRQ